MSTWRGINIQICDKVRKPLHSVCCQDKSYILKMTIVKAASEVLYSFGIGFPSVEGGLSSTQINSQKISSFRTTKTSKTNDLINSRYIQLMTHTVKDMNGR